ncbi:hypothetical protein cyc_06142 [Cyclospora cayetanensis]|uniref:Uncharacterized protein n=1 Tax=Cyclospora cayetanensis TaxID=88456 RepID=A0A1D3CR07_9EIME|nr:hypothetical protein cyc_06142 [Cyclospora cayetanensis]
MMDETAKTKQALKRGVCVRSGDPRHEEWGRVKTADLKLTYALHLLEKDMEHYRHMHREAERSERVRGRLKYFQAPVPAIRIPELWLEFPELAAAHGLEQPPAEWRSDRILGSFPELWRSLHAARWPEIETQTLKRKPATRQAPVKPGTAPSAGTSAPLASQAESSKASMKPATTSPGKSLPLAGAD